jgi:hypothetical protein
MDIIKNLWEGYEIGDNPEATVLKSISQTHST